MAQRVTADAAQHAKVRGRWGKRRWSVDKERRPRTYTYPWHDAYRLPMGDALPGGGEDWATYLRRMTSRPGWSVARLARESGVHRGTIFKWMSGKGGVTVASVRSIANALDDDPANALRAAGQVAPDLDPTDEELELVRTDERLSPETKMRIIAIILDRRDRERQASIAETKRIIEMMRRDEAG